MKMIVTNRTTNHDRQVTTGYNSVLPQLAMTFKIETERCYKIFVLINSPSVQNRQLR